MNKLIVDPQLVKDMEDILYVTVEMLGSTPAEVMLWRSQKDAFKHKKRRASPLPLYQDTAVKRHEPAENDIHVFCCLVQEGEPDENVPDSGAEDVEVIDQPLTQKEIDQKFKDAGICKFGEVK